MRRGTGGPERRTAVGDGDYAGFGRWQGLDVR